MLIKDICNSITDGSHNPPKGITDSSYLMLSSKNIYDYQITLDDPRFLSKGDFENEDKRTKVKTGDVLLTIVGTVGRAAVVTENLPPFTLQRSVAVLHPNEDICSGRYLMYALQGKRSYIESKSKGVAQKGIYLKEVAKIDLPVPTKADQSYIIEKLDNVAAIIKYRKSELKKLDELIKARFVELFGDPLDENKANYAFTDCVEFNPKKSEIKDLQDMEVSFVPMECVGVDGSFSIKEIGTVGDYYSGYTYFRDGDVLLAKITPCFENGKVAIAKNCANGIGFGTTEFHVSRPIEGVSNSTWIKYLLKNDLVHDYATINMSGSAGQKRIQTPFFNKLKIYVPPIDEQEQFAAFVEQVDKSKLLLLSISNYLDILTRNIQVIFTLRFVTLHHRK